MDSGVVSSIVVTVNVCSIAGCESVLVVSDEVVDGYFIIPIKVVVILVADFKCSLELRGKGLHHLPSPQRDAVFISDVGVVNLFFVGTHHTLYALPELFAVVGG